MIFKQLQELYTHMEAAYATVAQRMGLSCDSCQDNCCSSYFHHHTHIEWAYFWQGLHELPEAVRTRYLGRALRAEAETQTALSKGLRPQVMCPVNENGRCGMYSHRLMICRLHGVPNMLRQPNGQVTHFPGCWKSQEITAQNPEIPLLDRTPFYLRLAALERQFLGPKRRHPWPKVHLTLAQMIVQGPPSLEP